MRVSETFELTMPDNYLNVDALERYLAKEFDRKGGNSRLDWLIKGVLKKSGIPLMFLETVVKVVMTKESDT